MNFSQSLIYPAGSQKNDITPDIESDTVHFALVSPSRSFPSIYGKFLPMVEKQNGRRPKLFSISILKSNEIPILIFITGMQ